MSEVVRRQRTRKIIQKELDHIYSDYDFSRDVDDMNEVFGGESGDEEYWWEDYQKERDKEYTK